ncbi:MAG: sensor histidine kinase [Flavobacteriaceae bacterium]|nr:sensor histidine kinase [Flavobacteriaceae bacterium]
MVKELFTGENQIISIILIAIGLLLLMSIAIILFFYFSRKRIIKSELEKANLEIEHQKTILQSVIVTQEEERKRIAQDMHDAISSKLNVVSLNANILTEDDITIEEANQVGGSILKITNTVLESSRKIAHDLLPPTLQKFGLKAALEELCEEICETKKYQTVYVLDYKEGFLETNHELHVFRILQELVNNTIKHANATEIKLTLRTEENNLSLQYQDNGKGFNIESAKKARGLGMSGIENRVVILNGTLNIESKLGSGIKINITIDK